MGEITRYKYQGAALPADSDTETLFDSTVAWPNHPGTISRCGFHRFFLGLWHSQDGTVNEYASEDGGTTWRLVSTNALTAGSTEASLEFEVDPYRDWKLEWVNGGVTQTAFTPHMSFSTEPL